MENSPNIIKRSPSLIQGEPVVERVASNEPALSVECGKDMALVLDELVTTIRAFVILDEEQAIAAALWIFMTHLSDVAEILPLALITAPEKACGKSQLLTVFAYLVANPLSTSNCSASYIFRSIEQASPTLLIDEADTFFKDKSDLLGIVNAGHTRASAFVGRTESDGKGGFVPTQFNVFCPKALAGIAMERHLPSSTMSRCVVISLRRKTTNETVARLRHADRNRFTDLAGRLVQFGKKYAKHIGALRPELPDELDDRSQDNWELMIAIAEVAGIEWRERAIKSALKLSKANDNVTSIENRLLRDIRSVFAEQRIDRIRSADLIGSLCEDKEAPWATYNRGKQISSAQLAKLLSSYGPNLKSKTIRLGRNDTPKGYELSQFEDAFARYLPADSNGPLPAPIPGKECDEPEYLTKAIREIDPKYGKSISVNSASIAGSRFSLDHLADKRSEEDF